MDNSCVCKLEYEDGSFEVLSVNDMGYVKKGRKLRKIIITKENANEL